MLAVLGELRRLIELVDPAVDAHPDETARPQLLEQLLILALALAHHGGEQQQAGVLGQRQHLIHHLGDGLGGERPIVIGTARLAHAGVEQAQVVVDFGDGAHGGTRVVGGGFLLDGNRRRQPLDVIHVGLFHHREELPGVGRQGFHIAPLALGVEGVEGERRLARTGQPGDHDQAIAGQRQVDVLEVVGAGTANPDMLHDGCSLRLPINRAL